MSTRYESLDESLADRPDFVVASVPGSAVEELARFYAAHDLPILFESYCSGDVFEPGFAEAVIAPHPDARVTSMSAKIDTRHGEISCAWRYTEGRVRYEIATCVPTEIRIGDKTYHVNSGRYIF